MRDRLIDLLKVPIYPRDGVDPAEVVADYLLDNGVIVLPCKVGDTVYYRYYGGNRVYEGKVTSFIYNSESGWFGIYYDGGYGTYGKYVFLTREEAEQALKGDHHAEIH